MPSCLGIYTDKNMIKYAKVSWTTDKVAGQSLTLDSYGVKFYDNIQVSMEEIAEEVRKSKGDIEFTMLAEAKEYRQSISMERESA